MAIENALYKFIHSFILAAVALLQLCGRELLTKKCPFFQDTHTSLTVGRLVLNLQTKQLERNEQWLQKCVKFPDDALHVVVVLVWAASCFAIEKTVPSILT